MRIALDPNVLAYAENVQTGPNDPPRVAAAQRLVTRLAGTRPVLPVQVLGELYRVLRRRGGRSADAARATILFWRAAGEVQPTTDAVLVDALDLAADHGLTIFDAIILAAAATAGCAWLLSEDLHAGFVHRGVTIANPFAPAPPRALAALLA